MELENSGSYEVRYETEWLVYCTVLPIGFHSKLTKLVLPPYYDVPQVSYSIRYRLVLEIGQFKFFYPLNFTPNSPNFSALYIVLFPKFWTQYDIDCSMELENSGSSEVRSEMEWLMCCIVLSV
ncbi:unnamed protein product [Prunus armeniaca]